MKKNRFSFTLQIILSVLLLVIGVITIFYRKMFPVLEIVIACDLFCLAYNNCKLFKRKELTTMYIVFGVLVLIVGLLSLFGVM